MAEKIVRPTNMDDIGFRTAGSPTNAAVDPGAGVRGNGWAVDQIPGSDEFNWLMENYGDAFLWFQSMAARQFEELGEGITATAIRDLIRTIPGVGGTAKTRLSQIFSIVNKAPGPINVLQLATDGEKLYYVSGTAGEWLYAADNLNLGTEWVHNTPGNQMGAMDTDGDFVFWTSTAAAAGLRRVDAADGANVTAVGATYGHSHLRTTGFHVAAISGNTGAGDVDIWEADPIVLVATKATGSAGLLGLAVDVNQVYVGGARNTNDIWAYDLNTGNLAWQMQLDANPPTVNAICADGDFVYVATDSFATASGSNKSLFCLDRLGSVLWSVDFPDLKRIDVDHNYLYCTDASNNMYMVSLRGQGLAGVLDFQTNVGLRTALDGQHIYCQDASSTTKIRKLAVGEYTQTYLRVSGQDPRRKPFYNLAIPLDGRI